MSKLIAGIALLCGMSASEVTEDNALGHLESHVAKLKTGREDREKMASRSAGLNVKYGVRALAGLDPKKFSTGKIEKLSKILVSDDGTKPSGLLASLSADQDDKALDVLESIVKVLNEDDGGAVHKGEGSGFQRSLSHSRETPGAGEGGGEARKLPKINPWTDQPMKATG